MSEFEGVFLTRTDIARSAGVQRPAVTNWERRHADFPAPADRPAQAPTDVEVFSAADVLAWLDLRTVPANARRSEEPEGTTYGDRVRATLGGTGPRLLLKAVDRLLDVEAERFRGELSPADYITLLLSLLYVRACLPDAWQRIREEAKGGFPHTGALVARLLADVVDGGLGATHKAPLAALSRDLRDAPLTDTVRQLDATGPVDLREHAAAYERLLARYSDLVGKTAGDFFTPRAAVDVIARFVSEDGHDVRHVHDPYVRAGELLAASWDAVSESRRQGRGRGRVEASGAGVGEHPLALAGMNLALHGVSDVALRTGSTAPSNATGPGQEQNGGYDRVVTNPPFNAKLTGPTDDSRWRYGPPPRHNANFAWLQYAVTSLKPGGRAAVIMPDIAAFSANPKEQRIRAAMVEDGAVEALIALPPQLFTSTGISVMVWLLRYPTGGCDEVLFIDAGRLGTPVSRVRQELAPQDSQRVLAEYRRWLADRAEGRSFSGAEGLSEAASLDRIRDQGHLLSPALYVPASRADGPVPGDITVLAAQAARLADARTRARDADAAVERVLERYGL
ncbi:N-6 DNA methylase [Streptomyces ziwulingensis]|uniref:DNA methylase adenine-specific domain-containing protein n=1 Tax=Streptomyces ziwulingensis TaxID=1045501 RepID=A0ABP9AX00_9ACTN